MGIKITSSDVRQAPRADQEAVTSEQVLALSRRAQEAAADRPASVRNDIRPPPATGSGPSQVNRQAVKVTYRGEVHDY